MLDWEGNGVLIDWMEESGGVHCQRWPGQDQLKVIATMGAYQDGVAKVFTIPFPI
jgi:hypothetical protein